MPPWKREFITAVNGGKSIDTSLGFGTVPGVLMGTRCGDIDPTVVLYLMEQDAIDPKSMSHILHKQSGIQGYQASAATCATSRKLLARATRRAVLALNILCYGIRKHICAYAGAMGGIDAIVFTAGIGENSTTVRKMVCTGLEFLGARINHEKNNVRGKEASIGEPGSPVSILVVPTNEELVIARDTRELAIK